MNNLSEEEEYEKEDTLKDKFLTFQIASEEYGIEIRNVIEIIQYQEITEVPDTPEFIQGVINLRGSVIPVLDVRLCFGLHIKEFDDRTCVIVVNINNTSVGLLVDTVSEVVMIPSENIDPPPSRGVGRGFVTGMGKISDSVKILLDVNKLLFNDEFKVIEEIGS